MKNLIKKIFFILIVVALVFATGVVIKTGKFEKLEGYMYSLAAEITDSATSSDATSSDATSSNATSSDATSSNATSCNATSCDATSSNATSSNANTTETIKVTNPTTTPDTNTEEVEEVLEAEVKYNNSEITQDILDKISNSVETQNIIINMDDSANVSANLFEAIKGKEKRLTINVGENQIIFNGNNIVTSKEINAGITYGLVNEDTVLNEIVEKGIVINFANNGELPGTALVRIKATDEMKSELELDLDTIIVYHYDEEEKELTKLNNNATYSEDGFIEFSVSHNSKYLMVNNEIEEKEYEVPVNSDELKKEVSFLENHKMYIMIIGASVLVIIVVSIIIIVDKKVKKNTTKES